jgi:hypothetical protein
MEDDIKPPACLLHVKSHYQNKWQSTLNNINLPAFSIEFTLWDWLHHTPYPLSNKERWRQLSNLLGEQHTEVIYQAYLEWRNIHDLVTMTWSMLKKAQDIRVKELTTCRKMLQACLNGSNKNNKGELVKQDDEPISYVQFYEERRSIRDAWKKRLAYQAKRCDEERQICSAYVRTYPHSMRRFSCLTRDDGLKSLDELQCMWKENIQPCRSVLSLHQTYPPNFPRWMDAEEERRIVELATLAICGR